MAPRALPPATAAEQQQRCGCSAAAAAAASVGQPWLRGLLKMKPAPFRRRVFRIVSCRAAREEVFARLEAMTGAGRSWQKRLFKVKAVPYRRRVRKIRDILAAFFRGFLVPFDSFPCCSRQLSPSCYPPVRSLRPPLPFSEQLHEVIFAVLLVGFEGTIALHILIGAEVIMTQQKYFQMVIFWLKLMQRLLATAAKAWDAYNNLLWLWTGIGRKRRKQQVPTTAAEQSIPSPPPPELDMC